jgi:ubiquinone biosynthesis protein COQ9
MTANAPAPAMQETLDELRLRLAPVVAQNAAFDGWSPHVLDSVAEQTGVDRDVVGLAFDGGAVAMIDAWFTSIDKAMLEKCPPEMLAGLKVRARITQLVETRLGLLAKQRETLRRAQAVLTMPQNLPRATRLGWRTADVIWRAAGDVSADFNHYTKRATLAATYAATMLVFVNDESEGFAETRAFLARRIENIIQFEKTKARAAERADMRFDMARFLGRLRYRP